MQRYKCTKHVNAGKIAKIDYGNESTLITLESGEEVYSSREWRRNQTARRDDDDLIGGYLCLVRGWLRLVVARLGI